MDSLQSASLQIYYAIISETMEHGTLQ